MIMFFLSSIRFINSWSKSLFTLFSPLTTGKRKQSKKTVSHRQKLSELKSVSHYKNLPEFKTETQHKKLSELKSASHHQNLPERRQTVWGERSKPPCTADRELCRTHSQILQQAENGKTVRFRLRYSNKNGQISQNNYVNLSSDLHKSQDIPKFSLKKAILPTKRH